MPSPITPNMEAGWLCTWDEDGREGHVRPCDDVIDHPQSATCACGPERQSYLRSDGSVVRLYVHASLDGRELVEREEDDDD